MDASDWMPLPCVGTAVCSIGPDRPLGVTVVDLDVFPRRESWEMIESSHILYRESVL
jgi:hypothetical protein